MEQPGLDAVEHQVERQVAEGHGNDGVQGVRLPRAHQVAETLVDELVNDAESLKHMKRALKKRATFKTGNTLRHYAGVTWETLCSRHAVLFEKVKAQFPDAVWLNPLPEAEAFALWKEATR